ncbi:unnamed protein product [Pieris macdunnoughi]|uniref:Uncharacterized protein n=1 Tax=Pieris macdunnoughi TaxID=345717 RepID=A0A821UYD6_9NEOP|nr:unnamed protein product [Pieris macdunnoughi]
MLRIPWTAKKTNVLYLDGYTVLSTVCYQRILKTSEDQNSFMVAIIIKSLVGVTADTIFDWKNFRITNVRMFNV